MVSLDYPPTVGGIAAHVRELACALRAKGCELMVATRRHKSEPTRQVIDGIQVRRVGLRGIGAFYGWQINRFVHSLRDSFHPQILHVHGLRPLEWFQKKNTPLVFTNHTSGYLKRIARGGWRTRHLRRLFQKPDLILAPSEELLEMPFSVPGHKQFIPNGIATTRYARDEHMRHKIRKSLGLSSQDILGIVTRRLTPKNGVVSLAEATQFLKNPHIKLLFIGDGEERETVTQTLKAHFPHRTIMLGSLRHEEIIPYYSAADFSILPSLMEATSISGLEAMAAGLPLVGTRVGGIPMLIRDGKTGFLCNPADPQDLARKIDHLAQANYVSMGQAGHDYAARHFDWSSISQATLNAYQKVA